MRIACLGGSFNPPHRGHLAIALAAIRQAHVDEVWFIPSAQAPLREDVPVSFERRVAMLEAMIAPYRRLRVCPIEAELPQPSYTITTVTSLVQRFPEIEFAWIIGSDQADQFDRWKESEKLKSLIPFIVVPRDHHDRVPSWMQRLEVPGISAYSSTRYRQGQVHVAPPSVIRVAAQQGDYLESIVQSSVGAKRFEHIAGVVSVAIDLALQHGIDPTQAKIAALLHDLTKPWPIPLQKAWLSFCDPDYADHPDPILHQKTAVAYARRVLQVREPAILHAIGHHVDGASGHPLTQILYIADKCEPSRGYDASAVLAVAKRDLRAAAETVRQAQLTYLSKESHGSND